MYAQSDNDYKVNSLYIYELINQITYKCMHSQALACTCLFGEHFEGLTKASMHMHVHSVWFASCHSSESLVD